MKKKKKHPRSFPDLPDRKISETLLDFARPMVESALEEDKPEALESAFMIAIGVWNMCVVEAVGLREEDVEIFEETQENLKDNLLLDSLAAKTGPLRRRPEVYFRPPLEAQRRELVLWAEARDGRDL